MAESSIWGVNNMIEQISVLWKKYNKNPFYIMFEAVRRIQLINYLIPDKLYLKLMYRFRVGKKLDLKNPKTFNEKLQWLKLYDRKDEYTDMVDKYAAKKYVADKIGEEYIIPTIGVWNNPNEIDFDALPNQFVLKATHDSGGIIICKDKKLLNETMAKKKLSKIMKRNYFYVGREWPYKNVKPRVIAEKYMEDSSECALKDYKILCFNGEPQYIEVHIGRFQDHICNIYTTDWKYVNVAMGMKNDSSITIEKPLQLSEMLECAKKLSAGIPQVRIDFYIVKDKVYFGEMTFFDESGFGKMEPDSFDFEFGKLIKLPDITI